MEGTGGCVRLVLPTLEHKALALEMLREHLDHGETELHGDDGLDQAVCYEDWLEKLGQEGRPAEGSGLVPSTTYFAMTEHGIVGTLQIQHALNDFLLRFGGHIGYGVRPLERRKGNATRMLALALEQCRAIGLQRVLVVCDKDNMGSARTIQKNDGLLENEVAGEDGVIVQRYWIDLTHR